MSILLACQRCSAFASEQLTNYVGYTLTAGGIEIDAAGCNTMTLTCTGNNPYLDVILTKIIIL